jgi:natural product biosynthesis luciferase-like monooxygenase protein
MPVVARAVFVGEGSLLAQCAEAWAGEGHGVVAVVTAEPRLQEWARAQGTPVVAPGAGLAERLVAALAGAPFDYLFSVANLAVLPADVLALPREMAVNFHDALLPRYAGLHATNWALLHGETRHGITWHEMLARVDAGRLLVQREVEVGAADTAFSLNARCWEAGLEGFAALAAQVREGTLSPLPQPAEGRTYFGKYRRPAAACSFAPGAPAAAWSALFRALQFGPSANPLGLPRLRVDARTVVVPQGLEVLEGRTDFAPGTVTFVCPHGLELRVQTADTEVVLRGLTTPEGRTVDARTLGLAVGSPLPALSEEEAARLTALHEGSAKGEAAWVELLARPAHVELPLSRRAAPAQGLTASVALAGPAEGRAAAFALLLSRLSGQERLDVTLVHGATLEAVGPFGADLSARVPLRLEVAAEAPAAAAAAGVGQALERARARGPLARDVGPRTPALASLRQAGALVLPAVALALEAPASALGEGCELALVEEGGAARLAYDPGVYGAEQVEDLAGRVAQLQAELAARPDAPVRALSLMPAAERARVLSGWNATAVEVPGARTLHALFAAQVAATPDAVALVSGETRLTYAELDARAQKLARRLVALGVGPDVRVGLCVERGADLVVGVLGIHKAGGAYVPLDPAYPADRVAYMVADAAMPVLVTQSSLERRLPPSDARRVHVDDLGGAGLATDAEVAASAARVRPEHLAYVLYTSGSTGRPKGVMVTHANVSNFFAGMDARVPRGAGGGQGVWLAVTSLSFDISVLELLWTLARGLTVVVAPGQERQARAAARPAASRRPVGFSLFYFASDEGEAASASDKYRLLMEGARFADRHGFEAVWTPERHFHAFGGLYPNPSVASAAIAAITERVHIRAGSVVLPLHSPIRVAEEWALVDNLSRGRVGISFAAGWQPNDFAIQPFAFADRKARMFRDIETVKRLWRGETVPFAGPDGKDVAVRTLPRPVQRELPVWVTAAGNPETFAQAGASGAFLLTHLLGQSVEDLTVKVAAYRQAWKDAGHPGEGKVTLMLHTFVGDDEAQVKEAVREPMKGYLRSSVDLIKAAAWSFPTFAQKASASGKTPADTFDTKGLSAEEMDALLDFAFERYYRTSGLFGTPESCLAMVDAVKGAGVDELACLVDFGLPSAQALAHLEHLLRLKELSQPPAEGESLGALMKRHGATHLQCTPSLASMLVEDAEAAEGLGRLEAMMVGGEAFPPALARKLKALVGGSVINMYGPTETTVWSSTHALTGEESPVVPLGRPIANTRLYVVDRHLEPLPPGVPGELCIGGEGVARGYLHRPELTAERFVEDRLAGVPGARMYRTGDLARFRADGTLEFLGRLDHQVKVRGHRIELGEIEAAAREAPGVREAVVVAREDVPGDVRLVAYLTSGAGAPAPELSAAVKAHLAARLPESMVPAHLVVLPSLPQTPNGKVDRKALPAPESAQGGGGGGARAAFVAPEGEVEQVVARVWREVLHLERVGTRDNFFELGGHSLLMVQAQRLLKEALARDVALTDLFRFPTIEALAGHLNGGGAEGAAQALQQEASARADARTAALARRRAVVRPRS